MNRRLSKIQDGFFVAVLPPPVRGISNSGGFRMIVEDRAGLGSAALRQATTELMARASQTPGVATLADATLAGDIAIDAAGEVRAGGLNAGPFLIRDSTVGKPDRPAAAAASLPAQTVPL